MRWLVWAFLAPFALWSEEISYHICQKEELALTIICEFEGNEEGITDVIIPLMSRNFEVKEMHLLSPMSFIEETDHPSVRRFIYPSKEKIRLEYEVRMKDLPKQADSIIEPEYFLCFGYDLFIHPDGDMQRTVNVRLHWNDFFSLANSFGNDCSFQEISSPLWLFLNGIYGGGESFLFSLGDKEASILVGIYGNLSLNPERLGEVIQTVLSTQRQFWQDWDFPYTFVAVHSSGSPDFIVGQGTPNGFALFPNELFERSEKDWEDLAFVISHESFHTWNSIKMQPDITDYSMSWFVEGFTEYYAAKTLFYSGLMTEKRYLDLLDEYQRQYKLSPVRNESNERIRKDFWNCYEIQKLPYLRGFLLASQ